MDKNKWRSLLISLAISLGTGIVSAILTMGGMRDYADLLLLSAEGLGIYLPLISVGRFLNSVVTEHCNLRVGSEAHPCTQSLKCASMRISPLSVTRTIRKRTNRYQCRQIDPQTFRLGSGRVCECEG